MQKSLQFLGKKYGKSDALLLVEIEVLGDTPD